MFRFTDSTDVQLQNIRIENSPGWTVHFRSCDRVAVDAVQIDNCIYGPNADGITADSCRNVTISDSRIVAGDDAICIKNIRKVDPEYPDRTARQISVTNCHLVSRTNGFKIGTECVADIEDVTFANSTIREPIPGVDYEPDDRFPTPTSPHSGIALEMVDGAVLDGVSISNVTMKGPNAPIFIRAGNRPRYRQDHPILPDQSPIEPGSIRNVSINNVVAREAMRPAIVFGIPEQSVEHVSLSNLRIDALGGCSDSKVPNRDVPEKEGVYPESSKWGRLPAHGVYCRHVDGLTLEDVSVTPTEETVRPSVILEDVTDFHVDTFRGTAPAEAEAMIRLDHARRGILDGILLVEGEGAALEVSGEMTDRLTVSDCDFGDSETPIRTTSEVNDGALRSP